MNVSTFDGLPGCFADAAPVLPVIVIDHAADGVPLARALLAGGIRVLEVTLRTAAGLRAIEAIASALPEVIVGAGTVRTAGDVEAAASAGCRFVVSPGFSAAVGAAASARGLSYLPGVATATEVMQAMHDGHRFLKFFPAAAAGGVAMLKALAGPFADVRFCPTGGIDARTAPDYLALPTVPMVGGSWLTPAQALASRNWAEITRLAAQAKALEG